MTAAPLAARKRDGMTPRYRAMLAAAWLALAATPLNAGTSAQAVPAAQDGEVFYHVFMRSFRDANGDRQGDLKGLTEKLGYVRDLGMTAILLTPLQPSPYYHNYFATEFRAIDPDFGTMDDYFAFVRAAHAHGLKVYLDQEFQYVAEGHRWLTESRGRPNAPFGDHILWNRPGHQEPEPFLKQPAWQGYDGNYIGIAMVDMRQPAVKRYFRDFMLYWIDPHGDGSLRDGVDGYRIDHMMDDLDHKGRLTNLFADFWAPIFRAVRQRNPKVRIVAEQADWGYGEDWLKRGGVDKVFAFPLRGALTKLDKRKIMAAARDTEARTPPGKSQIVFVENHDVDRFASLVKSDRGRLRAGAALNVLLRGEPLIYYGQELGMRGRPRGNGMSDATHIPLREAFRWDADVEAPGSAIWYKGRGDQWWWTDAYNRSGDGVSLDAQRDDPASLYNWYRRLLAFRAARAEVRQGAQRLLCDDASSVLCVERTADGARTLILVNLGEALAPLPADAVRAGRGLRPALDSGVAGAADATLAPMEVRVLATPQTRRD